MVWNGRPVPNQLTKESGLLPAGPTKQPFPICIQQPNLPPHGPLSFCHVPKPVLPNFLTGNPEVKENRHGQSHCLRRPVALCGTEVGKFYLDVTYGNASPISWTCQVTITAPCWGTQHLPPSAKTNNPCFSRFHSDIPGTALSPKNGRPFSVSPGQVSPTRSLFPICLLHLQVSRLRAYLRLHPWS